MDFVGFLEAVALVLVLVLFVLVVAFTVLLADNKLESFDSQSWWDNDDG